MTTGAARQIAPPRPRITATRLKHIALSRTLIGLAIVAAVITRVPSVSAQSEMFKARLSPVPVESSRAGITGLGAATATLAGRSLAVRGTFDGMRTAATIAQIHLGPRGVRGPVMFNLTVTKATGGTLTGTFTLTAEQVEAVKSSRFYIQIHSEGAPDGNLWGWLLPPS